MLTLKELIYKEDKEMKERRKSETMECHYVFYLLTIPYIIISLTLSIPGYEALDTYTIYSDLFVFFTLISLLYRYLYKVKENGKFNNIFIKYKFIPVDINQLLLAKSILLSKYIIKQVLPVQIMSFIARIVYIYISGGRFFDLPLFIPLITGILTWIIIFTTMYINHNIYKI